MLRLYLLDIFKSAEYSRVHYYCTATSYTISFNNWLILFLFFTASNVCAFADFCLRYWILASHDLYSQSIYWFVISLLLYTNPWLFVFPPSIWTLGHHYNQFIGNVVTQYAEKELNKMSRFPSRNYYSIKGHAIITGWKSAYNIF